MVVDERAPLYFIGRDEVYPPMLFLVSDQDMFGRLEQIHLTVKTLEHFGHKDNVYLWEQHGRHCEYTEPFHENGESKFATLVCDFWEKIYKKAVSDSRPFCCTFCIDKVGICGIINTARNSEEDMQKRAYKLMKEWCDTLLSYQVRTQTPYTDGGLLCPACHVIHGRIADLCFPLSVIWSKTGDEAYLA